MKKRTVYRMEYTDGKGPYIDVESIGLPKKSLKLLEELGEAHSDDYAFHPAIYLDIDSTIDKDMLCGCPTEKSLKRWFGEYFDKLLEIGFRVATYKTSNYIMGKSGKQLIFSP